MDVTDMNVLITGAAGGLGKELSLAFGSRGARIIALDIHPEALQALKHALEERQISCNTYVCDIADKQQCRRVVAEMEAHGITLDMVIHNAGISHRSTFAQTRLDVLEKIIAVNISGTINLTHFTLDHLIRSKGTYVVISSVAGFAPLMGRTGYAASKHALHGFFETLRVEVEEDGVNVLIVCPSFMKTAMEHTAYGGDGEHVVQKKQTVGNVLTPEFVAGQIVKGVMAKRKRIYISPVAKLSLITSRIAPGLYRRIMKRSVRGEFYKNMKLLGGLRKSEPIACSDSQID